MQRALLHLFAFGFFCLALLPSSASAEPLRVLLLDYNAPVEHDVLLSHLCVDRCTASRGCPEELVRQGVDYWSRDFIVFRPRYLGTASFVVGAYRNKKIDLISFSGHHASGFSGDFGHGRFDTEALAETFAEAKGVEPFFTNPALVMLQGCRTDVKSRFDGDPVEYVMHVIEDTQVREDEFERLLAAVQQIGGVQEAYRPLFPNACILGYRGTQTPGGRLEIYGQVHSWLRGMLPAAPAAKFDLRETYRSYDRAKELGRQIERECPSGWPCNLCSNDSGTYRPLANALARFLRWQRARIHERRQGLGTSDAAQLERRFEGSSFYGNTRWSCAVSRPGTPPVWPDPVDESPFGRLFMQLLLLQPGGLAPAQQAQLGSELVHRLGTIEFSEIDSIELRVWLKAGEHWGLFLDYLRGPLISMSTFRQRSFLAFLANIGCSDCYAEVQAETMPSLVRENAASQLRPGVGREAYLRALRDPDPRVREAARTRFGELVSGLMSLAPL